MKTFYCIVLIPLLLSLLTNAQTSHSLLSDQNNNSHNIRTAEITDTTGKVLYLDVNRIKMPISNYGAMAVDTVQQDRVSGGKYDEGTFLCTGGFWLSGLNNGTVWANAMAPSSTYSFYQPGPVGSEPGDPLNIIYTVRSSDAPFGTSWQRWKDAVQFGADFYDGDNDGIYNPEDKNSNGLWESGEDRPVLTGDITAFCVYNDAIKSDEMFSGVTPQGIEVHQTVFASHGSDFEAMKNAVFIKYKILNKNALTNKMDSVYFGIWTDADIGHYKDLCGVDTTISSAFVYDKGEDEVYGINPPCFVVSLLQGPAVYIPGRTYIDANLNGKFDDGETALDTAKYFRGNGITPEIFSGAKNINITSFTPYYSGHTILGRPDNTHEMRNLMLGLTRQGKLMNSCTWSYSEVKGEDCNSLNPKFVYSGDPAAQTGWLNNLPDDQKMTLNIGPFTLEKDKPVEIVTAYIVGRGTDAINSVSVAKGYAKEIIKSFNDNFTDIPVSVNKNENRITGYKLFQNYPNPFNPVTNFGFRIAEFGFVVLKVYDVLGNEVAVVVNEQKQPGYYQVKFDGSNLSSGVYFYQLRTNDFVQTRKMLLVR